MTPCYQFISGAIMMACLVAGVFFFQFRKKTGDSFFTIFGLAFFIFALERILILVDQAQLAEKHPLIYLVRLLGFTLILFGIVAKNRKR